MSISALRILRKIAQSGTAPDEGCARFGVGYDDAFARLRKEYLEDVFDDGGASCKVVIGDYGSGKTHFLRQFSEFSIEHGCVTAFVKLNTDIAFTDNLTVYRQVAKSLELPAVQEKGVAALLWALRDRLDGSYEGADLRVHRLAAWVHDDHERIDLGFHERTFARIVRKAIRAMIAGDAEMARAAVRWLEGDVGEPALARKLDVGVVKSSETRLFGREALLSLFQLIRFAGFQGTIVCFDEAEQSINVNKAKKQQILANLRSTLDALSDLEDGSALVFYAVTPDVAEAALTYPALQGRLQDPAPGRGFWDGRGNVRAMKVDMDYRDAPVLDLERIGLGLVAMLYNEKGELASSRDEVEAMLRRVAEDIVSTEPRSSARRTMAKRTAFMLMELYDHGELRFPEAGESVLEEPEV
jgi:hypothetical protein